MCSAVESDSLDYGPGGASSGFVMKKDLTIQ